MTAAHVGTIDSATLPSDTCKLRPEHEMNTSRLLRWSGYFGLAAAAVYVGATIAGSVLDPLYSQLRQHVSDPTATGAPTRAALAPAYLFYNLLAVVFATTLYLASKRSRLFKLGLALLVINAIAGVMMVTWFAEDLKGAPRTLAGTGHVVFAIVSSLATVAGSFMFGFAFGRSRAWHLLSLFSFATGIAFLLVAPLAVIATASHNLAGLAERAAIAPFVIWLLVVGAYALHEGGRRAEPERRRHSITAG